MEGIPSKQTVVDFFTLNGNERTGQWMLYKAREMDNIPAALRKALTEAEAKPLGAGILKPEKQAILARARQLAGCQEEEIECEIYKKKIISSLVVPTL